MPNPILLNPIIAEPALFDPIQYVWLFLISILVEGILAILLILWRLHNQKAFIPLFLGIQTGSFLCTIAFSFLLFWLEYLFFGVAQTQIIHWAELLPLIAEPLAYRRFLKAELSTELNYPKAIRARYLTVVVISMNVASYAVGAWWQG